MTITPDPRVVTDDQREALIMMSLQFLAKAGVHATVESPNGSTLVVRIRRPWRKKSKATKAQNVRFYSAD